MCGIVLIVGERRDQRALTSMVASLAMRGPDAEGVAKRDYYGLGFRRLAIFASELGHQPVSDAARMVTLAFNGEIYNYGALASDVLLQCRVAVRSEAEALLALYLSDGVAFVERLDGDYAIVVCDDRTRECHLFRDPFGVKPLYYAPLGGGGAWAAASEVQAFFHHPEFSTDWDDVALWERRVLGFAAFDRTSFAAIRQVPPGARVTLSPPAQPRVIDASDEPGVPRPGEPPLDRITEQCAAVLRRAVERRVLHSEHFPVAIALSGGIDSTIIACLSSRIPAGKIVAITIGGAAREEDAMISRRVAAGFSIPRSFESVSAESLYSSYPRIALTFGAQGAAYSAYFLGEAVRRHWTGAKVALCGEGADELFLGYRMHIHAGPYVERAVEALTNVPGDSIEASPLLQVVAGWRSLDPQGIRTQLNRLLRTHQLVNRHLIPFDHGMMAHGIECRVPFLDREVARFVGRVPEVARTAGDTSKLLLRLVASDLLRPFGLELERLVLDRKPSPLPAAMNDARAALSRRIGRLIAQLDLERSRLARFANRPEDLFWLGAVGAVFLRQRAQIEDMDLAAMEVEIADVVTH